VLTEPTVVQPVEGKALSVRDPANGALKPEYEVRFDGSTQDDQNNPYTVSSVVPTSLLSPVSTTTVTIKVTIAGQSDTWTYSSNPAQNESPNAPSE
jgi:hypothetical protein